MSNQSGNYDQFDPDNLDMEEIIKKRWKSKRGKVVGFNNNNLPTFKKVFLDPHQLSQQKLSDKTKEFLSQNDIAIKSLDGQPCPYPFLTWEATQFPPQIQNVLNDLKFRAPTPIQATVFPLILSGYDVIGVAETGSGKTFGYLLPGLIQIKCQSFQPGQRDRINGPELLILAPTRELVMQIAQQVTYFMKPNNLIVATAFGGQNRDSQKADMKRNPHILVACPGRLKDFIQDGIVSLQKVTYLVIDEADRLLDMGFEDDVRFIVEQTRLDRQTVFFSATWPKAVRNLSLDFCSQEPIYVQIGRSNLTINKNIDQEVICLHNNQKLQRLLDILDQLKITDKVLIFAETRKSCEQLSVDMTKEGYYAVALHGDKTQAQRDNIMAYYKKGETKLLCATDLASRGLDVSDITVVINYDFPKYFDDYIHRIGRTGRAGRKGRAISFFAFGKDQPQMARELLKFNKIHKLNLDEKIMEDIAKGIFFPQEKHFNNHGVFKYGGQIMTHQNSSKFTVPNLTEEDKAKFYLQPNFYDNMQGRESHYGRQNQHRNNKGQYQEEQFYQDKYQNHQSRNQNRSDQQPNFFGQRKQDYLDNRRDNDRKQQPRYGNQGWQNNQQESRGGGFDQQRDQQRQDRNDFQYRQTPQQGFPFQNRDQWNSNQRDQWNSNQRDQWNSNQRDQWNSNQRDQWNSNQRDQWNSNQRDQWNSNQRDQWNSNQRDQWNPNQRDQQNPNQRDQQNSNYRDQQNSNQRDQWNPNQSRSYQDQFNTNQRGQPRGQNNNQRDQQRNPFVNDKDQNQSANLQPFDQGRSFNPNRGEGQGENYRNQNNPSRQYDNQDNNYRFRQGFSQNESYQQQMRTNPPDNYRDRNQNQPDYRQNNDRFYQDSRQQNSGQQREPYNNQRFNSDQQNNNQRENNARRFQDSNKPQDDNQQIRKDSSQYLGPDTQEAQDKDFNFNNFNPNEEQIQQRNKVQDVQTNLDLSGRAQKDGLNEFSVKDQEVNPKGGGFQDSQYPNFNRMNNPIVGQEQQFNQQFVQRQDPNTFVNPRFQNQQQGPDRQYNQRTLLDQKMDQIMSSQDNQQDYRQRQYQENIRQPQQDVQNFNRNERILDQEDDNENQIDFTGYSRSIDDSKRRFEFEQAPKVNQQELRNSRKNSDQQQQSKKQEQNTVDSQIQY